MGTNEQRTRIGRAMWQFALDLEFTQLEDDDLGEYIEQQECDAIEERRREARRRELTACGGWAGGMVPVRAS